MHVLLLKVTRAAFEAFQQTRDLRLLHAQANGGVNYQGKVAVAASGAQIAQGLPGGVLLLDPVSLTWQWLVNNFLGNHFNSPNDLVALRDNSIIFTDPSYGFNQGFNGMMLGSPSFFVLKYKPAAYDNTVTDSVTDHLSKIMLQPAFLLLHPQHTAAPSLLTCIPA